MDQHPANKWLRGVQFQEITARHSLGLHSPFALKLFFQIRPDQTDRGESVSSPGVEVERGRCPEEGQEPAIEVQGQEEQE